MCRVLSGPHLGQVSPAPPDLQQQKNANLFRAPESLVSHVLSQSHSGCAVLHFFIKPMVMVSILHLLSQQERQISGFAGNSIYCGPALGKKSGNICIYCPAGHVCMVYMQELHENIGGGGLDLSVACQHNLVHMAQRRQMPGICIAVLIQLRS